MTWTSEQHEGFVRRWCLEVETAPEVFVDRFGIDPALVKRAALEEIVLEEERLRRLRARVEAMA